MRQERHGFLQIRATAPGSLRVVSLHTVWLGRNDLQKRSTKSSGTLSVNPEIFSSSATIHKSPPNSIRFNQEPGEHRGRVISKSWSYTPLLRTRSMWRT